MTMANDQMANRGIAIIQAMIATMQWGMRDHPIFQEWLKALNQYKLRPNVFTAYDVIRLVRRPCSPFSPPLPDAGDWLRCVEGPAPSYRGPWTLPSLIPRRERPRR